MAKCAPGCNWHAHFFQAAQKRNPQIISPKKTPRIPAVFSGEMRTRPQFKFAFSSGGVKKNPKAVPPKKCARVSGGVLAAKCAPARNSNSHYLHRSLTRSPGAVSLPKKRHNSGVFGGEISTRSLFEFAVSSGGAAEKKNRGGSAEK